MPTFDPTVPLGITSPQINSLSGFAAAGELAHTQNELISSRNAALTLAAKQRAGAIMASAPDMQSGIDALTRDPATASFVPEIASTLQALRASEVAVQGAQQEQATTGFGAIMKSLLPALRDPTTFEANVASIMPTLSPSAQASMTASLPAIKAALVDGLPQGEAAGPAYQQRLSAMLIGAGVPPDSIRSLTGTLAPQLATTVGPEGQPQTRVIGGPVTGTGVSGMIAEGPTTEKAAELAGQGAGAIDIAKDAAADAANIPATAIKLNNIVEALGEFQSGGGADIRAGFAKGLQAFKNLGISGITDKMVQDVGNGSLEGSQFFTANIRPFVINQLKEAAQGTGRVMRSEVDAFLSMADITNDPNTLLDILNQAKKMLQIGYDRSQRYPEFKQMLEKGDPTAEHYGPLGFDQWYSDNVNLDKLPNKTSGGIDLGPAERSQVRGTTVGGAAGADTKSKLDAIFGAQ